MRAPMISDGSHDESAQIRRLIADIDSLCTDDRWDAVVELRDSCRLAVARGHQWWPAAAWAEYRLALDGPGHLAAGVLESTLSRYTLGPFAEVAASTHSWDELVAHLEPTPASAVFAHECVALGDDLRTDDIFRSLPAVFDVPAALQPWEPAYGPVVYHLDRVEHLAPILPDGATGGRVESRVGPGRASGPTVQTMEDQATCEAFAAVLAPWSQTLQWSVMTVAVDGDVQDAVGVWAARTNEQCESVQVFALPQETALRYLAWLGASGGPNGRRRGLAASRSALWWVLLQLTGIADDLDGEPVASAGPQLLESLASALRSLHWFTWSTPTGTDKQPVVEPTLGDEFAGGTGDAGDTQRGWTVHLAAVAPGEGITWLLGADAVRTDR